MAAKTKRCCLSCSPDRGSVQELKDKRMFHHLCQGISWLCMPKLWLPFCLPHILSFTSLGTGGVTIPGNMQKNMDLAPGYGLMVTRVVVLGSWLDLIILNDFPKMNSLSLWLEGRTVPAHLQWQEQLEVQGVNTHQWQFYIFKWICKSSQVSKNTWIVLTTSWMHKIKVWFINSISTVSTSTPLKIQLIQQCQ